MLLLQAAQLALELTFPLLRSLKLLLQYPEAPTEHAQPISCTPLSLAMQTHIVVLCDLAPM